MPAADRQARGAATEAAAHALLLRAGLRAVAANARYRGGELDLVMLDGSRRDGEVLVFVEVRYRRDRAFGGGVASIDAGKRRRLVHAAQCFLAEHPQYAATPCRFDVIEAEGEPPSLNWLKDAFRADDV